MARVTGGFTSSRSDQTNSIEFDKLLFSHHALCFVRMISDAISDASIRLNGHLPNDGIDVCLLNELSTPRFLSKAANVRVWLIDMGHSAPFRCLQATTR